MRVSAIAGHARKVGGCPECRATFVARGPRQMFCSPEHKKIFERRLYSRGVSLTPLIMAARITRGGTRGENAAAGRVARGAAEQLIDRWNAEDKAAARMTMDAFVALRMHLGHDQR